MQTVGLGIAFECVPGWGVGGFRVGGLGYGVWEDLDRVVGPSEQESFSKTTNYDFRGSTYTTIRELGPMIPSTVWHCGA